MLTVVEPDWREYAAELAALKTPDAIRAEIADQRKCLRVLESLTATMQSGHSIVQARLRLSERALQAILARCPV